MCRRQAARWCQNQRPEHLGFQVLECQANIENRFGTGADHSHIGVSQFLQVGRNVQCGLGASVDTTDAARRKDPDTSQMAMIMVEATVVAPSRPLAR
jgi:hypothetical protein